MGFDTIIVLIGLVVVCIIAPALIPTAIIILVVMTVLASAVKILEEYWKRF